MRLHAAVLAVLVTGTSISASALAAGVDPAQATAVQREQAQALFGKGKKLYDAGKYADALVEFRGSIEIVQSPNTRLYVARTLREMGRLVEAYAEFGRTAAEAKEHEHEDGRYGKAAQAALAERADLGKKLGFVRLAIQGASDDSKLVVGGNEVVRAGWVEPVPTMPGTVDVTLTTGNNEVKRTATVAAGQTVDVSLDVGTATAVTTPPPPPPSTPDTAGGMPIWRPLWIGGYGVGAVGLVMFAVGGAMSNGTFSDVKAACPSAPCPPSQASLVARGQREQTIANVGLVIGLVGVALGTTFLVLDLTSKKKSQDPGAPPTPTAELLVGPASLGFRTTF